MFKFLVGVLLLVSISQAKEKNEISIDFLTLSQHFEKKYSYQGNNYDYNGDHNYFGVNYKFENSYLPEDFFNELSFATFKNSYFDRTYMIGGNIGYKAYEANIFNDYKLEVGIQAALGIQKGYCNYAQNKCEGNENDISIFAVPSFFTNVERLKLSYFVMPGVCGLKVGMNIIEW